MDGVQFAFLNQLLDTFRTASVTGMVNLKPLCVRFSSRSWYFRYNCYVGPLFWRNAGKRNNR